MPLILLCLLPCLEFEESEFDLVLFVGKTRHKGMEGDTRSYSFSDGPPYRDQHP